MEIFKEIHPLKVFLKNNRLRGNSIGLVPTMGALHKGHISLIETSRQQNQITVCSIYVNPTQFNNADDLLKYPRTLDLDLSLLEKTGCDAVFYPNNEEMYPEKSVVKFDFGELDKVMEGKFRPGHFSGVALVVSKFFNIVTPDHAYFGQKDWQQYAVIQKLVDELKFGLTLHCVETLREPDGLAMSSRNLRLDEVQRKKAIVLYQSLLQAKEALNAGKPIEAVKKQVEEKISQQGVRLEYFEIADSKNLNLLESVKEKKNRAILCIAGFVGEVRLIDNIFLD
jgi:pantoate--beta-alanine ligase